MTTTPRGMTPEEVKEAREFVARWIDADTPEYPCPQKYALTDCREAATSAPEARGGLIETLRGILRDRLGDSFPAQQSRTVKDFSAALTDGEPEAGREVKP